MKGVLVWREYEGSTCLPMLISEGEGSEVRIRREYEGSTCLPMSISEGEGSEEIQREYEGSICRAACDVKLMT